MKIVHLCLSCFYIDNFDYQENCLVREHIKSGFDVTIIASTETYSEGERIYVEPGEYVGCDGAKVIRLQYCSWLPFKLARKVRKHNGVYDLLKSIKPDVIVFHGLCGYELLTVSRFLAHNPKVKFWVDSHEDFNNSARNLPGYLLHKLFYKPIIKKSITSNQKILCISLDTIEFVKKMYDIPERQLIFYPLGSNLLGNKEYAIKRTERRKELGFSEDDIVILQSGKMGFRKKVVESILEFKKVTASNLKLIIIGSVLKEIESKFYAEIEQDSRIIYLGWKSANDLGEYLCAADVYLQPGTQSVTMQASLGARCAPILDNVLSHEPYVKNNGWLISQTAELEEVFYEISELTREEIERMQAESFNIASEILDYSKLAKYLVDSNPHI